MNFHRLSPAVLGLCALFSLIFVRLVHAEELPFVEIPLGAFYNEKPIELQGLISSQSLTIPIPESWSLGNDTWVEIVAGTNPSLDQNRTSLTISLNGQRVTTYNPVKAQETNLRIHLPAEAFSVGPNTLTFTGTLYLPDDPATDCQNWDDPARWLSIAPTTLLHLSYQPRNPQLDLANFPQNFIDPLAQYLPEESQKPTLIVLPQATSQDDLSALSSLSYVLGSHADDEFAWQPDIITHSQFNSHIAAQRNIVFIGEAPSEAQDPAETAKDHLALLPSPWSVGHAVLVIADQNRQDGFSPVDVFSDPTRNLLLRGTLAYIDQPLAPPPLQPFPNILSFEDLGYLDRTIRGIGEQNLIYSFYMPYDIEPFLVNLHLGLDLSPDLDIRNSSFTVYLNGFSVAGLLAPTQSSTAEPVTLGLPARTFRRGINYIRIRSDLHTPSGSCERVPESIWATVLNSSTLEITYRNHTPLPSLKDFPLPFSDIPGTAFVIPDHYSQEDLNYLSRLSFLLGSSSYYPYGLPQILTASRFQPQSVEYTNVILIGLPSDNPVTRSANALLPQPFEENGNSLQEGYGVYLPTSDQNASLGLMQIMPSPWVKGGTVLVLSGNDPQGLAWAWDAILDPASREQFAGNLLLVGSEHRTETSDLIVQQAADVSSIPILGSLLQSSGKDILLPIFAAIGTALLLIFILFWSMRRMRARKLKTVMEKMEADEDHEQ